METKPDTKQMFIFVVFKTCYELNWKSKLLSTIITAYQVLLFCTSGGKIVTVNKLLIVRFPPFNAGVADGLINMQHFVPTFAISEGRDSLLSHKQNAQSSNIILFNGKT